MLLEKDYGPPIDVWAVGCVMGELLMKMKEHKNLDGNGLPLFPGTSCFPLSPAANEEENANDGHPATQDDQLAKIISVIGTPDVADQSFITDEKASTYIAGFGEFPRTEWKKKFPAAGEDALDLLDKLL